MRLALLCCLLLAAAPAFSQSKKQLKIMALERQRFDAMTQRDTALLRSLLADDLTYLHSNGLLESKAEHLANIGAGNLVYSNIEPVEMNVRVHGRSAIGNGVIKVHGTVKGNAFDILIRYTDIYLKTKGNWQLAAWQSLKLEAGK
jgi:ketosteroid isomerase-like protein